MYTRNHLLVSLAISGALVIWTTPPDPGLVVAVTTAAGTAIDFDHFLIARVQTGSWDAVRRGMTDPRRFLVRQSELFERGDIGVLHRLLSHTVLAGVAVGAVYFVAAELTVPVALGLYAHLLTDLVADVIRVDSTVVHAADG